ncbi:MAG: tetratricopeptide repeat protein [Casimicrobiaceae bacterium]
MQSPVSRNASCPCGSGKRFKECHGLLASPEEATVVASDELRQTLDAALAAQMAERFAEAVTLYQRVVAAQPGNFDALHMLGVVHYQCAELEQARARVRAALRLRPFDSAVRRNFELIEAALERRTVEQDICRDVLPRLASRCVAADAPDGYRRRDVALDIVVLRTDMDAQWGELARLIRWLKSRAITVWTEPVSPSPPPTAVALQKIDPGTGKVPRAGHTVFFGADRAPGDWFASVTAASTALYCSDEPHCLLLDRIPELAREGRAPLRLLFSSAAHARRIGLPGTVVADEAGDTASARMR